MIHKGACAYVCLYTCLPIHEFMGKHVRDFSIPEHDQLVITQYVCKVSVLNRIPLGMLSLHHNTLAESKGMGTLKVS